MNKKYFFLITALFALMGGVRAASINTNGGIVAKQLYQIRAYEQSRGALYAGNLANNGPQAEGYLSACGSTLTSADGYRDFSSVNISTSDPYQQFAFIQVGSNYYLYNVGARSLCYVSGNNVKFGTTAESVTLTAVTKLLRTSCALLKFNTSNKFLTFSNNTNGKYAIYPQSGISTNTDDGGCALYINKIDGATLSDADLLYAENLIDGRINTAINKAQEKLNMSTETQVGYPIASVRNTLSTAISTFQNKVSNSSATDADITTLNNAVNSYISSTDVNKPEDGHAYTFTFKHMDGTRTYLYWNGSKITSAVLGTGALPEAAYFVCRKVDTKYMFVNPKSGKYLVWWGGSGDGGYENNNGYTSAYDANKNLFEVNKITNGNNVQATNEDLFGCVGLMGKRNNSDANSYFILKNTAGGAVASSSPYVDKTTTDANYRSCAVMIEEVDYYNKLKFQTPLTEDGNKYASIYLPYAATVPAGATAYTGTLNSDQSRLLLTPIVGNTIPKETAVVMIAPSSEPLDIVYVAPATENGPTVSGNSLKGKLETVARDPIIYTYVLNGGYGPIGFYEYTASNLPKGRAYFETINRVPSSGAGTNAKGYLFDFGNGETTGISNATIGNETETTYYDLSGRRIAAPKHGLYIRNGKKVYIK